MKLSVVIPAFNEERLLPATLAHLAAAIQAFEARGWAAEVIVCDNNSTDATAQVARAAAARVVFEPVNQIARARNAGAAAASGDWLLFVDADCQPGVALFEDLFAAIERNDGIGGGSTVACDTNQLLVRAWVAAWNLLSRLTGWAAGCFLFCRADAFRAVGGFSEALYAAEEIDLSRRLSRYARERHKRFVILHRHPVLTSARKAKLYSAREHAAFLLATLLSGGRSLRRRESCGIWYDGRR